MSFGKMNVFIELVENKKVLDEEGFAETKSVTIAKVRAYREGRHGSELWANRSVFSSATDLFRFRAIPKIKVTTDMELICGDERFEIFSVEDVKGRGMYIEVLAKEVGAYGTP